MGTQNIPYTRVVLLMGFALSKKIYHLTYIAACALFTPRHFEQRLPLRITAAHGSDEAEHSA